MHLGRLTLGRSRGAICTAAALALMLAACGGDDEPAPDEEEPSSSTNTANALSLNGEWPLTGEPLDGDLPEHPVYIVKVGNTADAAPQIGLDSADLIVEQLVEGGLTRLAVFYYQDMPKAVGPVRSLRHSDVGIAKPASATLLASGGSVRTVARIRGAGISIVRETSSDFYYRDGERVAPHNLFAELAKVAQEPDENWTPPEDPYLPFGDEHDFTGTMPVTSIAAQFSGATTTHWEYTGQRWVRPGSNAASGQDFSPDNILVLRVQTRNTGGYDPAGNPVPETVFAGAGDAVLVHGDKALECRWFKPVLGSPLKLRMKNGDPVVVPQGRTWIELVPTDGGQVMLGR